MDVSVPRVMGVLNVTPDSFYDGGKYNDSVSIKNRVIKMVEEGADIIDIGAFSSRPGSIIVSEDEELERLRNAVGIIRKLYPDYPLSIDTFRARTAEVMIREFSVAMINDITAGNGDPDMLQLIADSKVAYVIMHMQGNPAIMQKNPEYKNVVSDLLMFFSGKSAELKSLGINDYIIDPGFGFGKTIDHNYELINKLELFSIFDAPLMIGISRKSLIYNLLDTSPEYSLNGTTALHMTALMKGTNLLRVHDVKEAKEVINIYLKISSCARG